MNKQIKWNDKKKVDRMMSWLSVHRMQVYLNVEWIVDTRSWFVGSEKKAHNIF